MILVSEDERLPTARVDWTLFIRREDDSKRVSGAEMGSRDEEEVDGEGGASGEKIKDESGRIRKATTVWISCTCFNLEQAKSVRLKVRKRSTGWKEVGRQAAWRPEAGTDSQYCIYLRVLFGATRRRQSFLLSLQELYSGAIFGTIKKHGGETVFAFCRGMCLSLLKFYKRTPGRKYLGYVKTYSATRWPLDLMKGSVPPVPGWSFPRPL